MYSLTTTAKKILFRKSCKITLSCKERVVANKLYAANNLLQQGLGLIGRKLLPGEALLFFMQKKQRFSLHMWFVFHPIDVLFCDISPKGFLVVEIKRRFEPFSFYKARNLTDIFIELPVSATTHLKPGDEIISSRKIFKR